MAISQEVSVFPFVVSPVAQDRVQFWAQFASRAVTQNDFDAVGWAYGAFWMESGAQEAYRRACAAVQQFGALSAVCWLDVVVSYLTTSRGGRMFVVSWLHCHSYRVK
jgi:hypothetical protein